jgi:RNA polymerase sigma factor (sigma-70 family)
LAARSIAGDDAAFAMLMSRHKEWVYRFIRRYVGGGSDAYDVLQDTFFAAWRALSRYHGDRPFEFWLRRIALNKCRDRNRREVVRRLIGGRAGGGQIPEVMDPAPGPAALTETGQELRRLERHLSVLPRSLKEPLLLTALEGLTHEAAGQILGISAKAVETKVYRARGRLIELNASKTRGPA